MSDGDTQATVQSSHWTNDKPELLAISDGPHSIIFDRYYT